jgi:hypothetical protein
MRKLCIISVSILVMLVLFSSVASSAEDDVLEALERLKAGIENEASYTEVAELMEEAGVQVGAIKKGDTTDCFRIAAKRSYYWYRLGTKSWETLIKNQEQRDIHAKRSRSEYWDDSTKTISLKMVENYDKLIKHAEEALPSKWEYGHAALNQAHKCLEK